MTYDEVIDDIWVGIDEVAESWRRFARAIGCSLANLVESCGRFARALDDALCAPRRRRSAKAKAKRRRKPHVARCRR